MKHFSELQAEFGVLVEELRAAETDTEKDALLAKLQAVIDETRRYLQEKRAEIKARNTPDQA